MKNENGVEICDLDEYEMSISMQRWEMSLHNDLHVSLVL